MVIAVAMAALRGSLGMLRMAFEAVYQVLLAVALLAIAALAGALGSLDRGTTSESATFWASIAQLIALALAWVAFRKQHKDSRKQDHRRISSLLTGLDAELGSISLWASAVPPDNSGYPPGFVPDDGTIEEWASPSRRIFPMNYPTIASLARSPEVGSLVGIVEPFVALHYSLTRLEAEHAEYRSFVNSRPELFDRWTEQLAQVSDGRAGFSDDVRAFIDQVFQWNYEIHVSHIGGVGSRADCLYATYRRAKVVLDACVAKHEHPEPAPLWYCLIDAVAASLLLVGLVLALLWLRF